MYTIDCFMASYGVVKLLFKKKFFFVRLLNLSIFLSYDSWEYELLLQNIHFLVVDLNIILSVSIILQYLKKNYG
jgi:hypothetical protein